MQHNSTDNNLKGNNTLFPQSGLPKAQDFAELYQRYLPQVYRYHLARCGEVTTAQDLTTQTFIAALEGLARFRGQGSFLAWLMGIARRQAALHFRSQRPTVDLAEAELYADPAPLPESAVLSRLTRQTLYQALSQLSPDRAEAVALCVIADLTSREAAEVLGKTPAAVKMLVLRGLRDLRNILSSNSLEVE